MHERERHRVILAMVASQPVTRVAELVARTGVSEATIRRDIATLAEAGKLRRIRGGAEPLTPPVAGALSGRPYSISQTINVAQKAAIARAAVALCRDGDSIIINGGTTTFEMVHHLVDHRLQILTNSLPIMDHLRHHSRNTLTMPGGVVYREQNIVLSPFDNDVTRNFCATKMFMGAQGIGPLGIMEADPLLIQAEQKLIDQADELILLVDSSKFRRRSSLILCPLERASRLITDRGITEADRRLIDQAGVELIVVDVEETSRRPPAPYAVGG